MMVRIPPTTTLSVSKCVSLPFCFGTLAGFSLRSNIRGFRMGDVDKRGHNPHHSRIERVLVEVKLLALIVGNRLRNL